MRAANFIAFDLGASSGRAVLGALGDGRIELREIHRFANGPTRLLDGLYWNAPLLLDEIKRGLTIAAAEKTPLAGFGIDTWGVDYGLVAPDGTLLGLPRHYRDPRTRDVMAEALARVPREEIYATTGVQFMALNTLYQLLADARAGDGRLEAAAGRFVRPQSGQSGNSPDSSIATEGSTACVNREHGAATQRIPAAAGTLLFMPCLLSYWLTGERVAEQSIASTSQMFDPARMSWADELLKRFELPPEILPPIVPPGTMLGALRASIREETGVEGGSVFLPACHDTACAIAAVPAQGDEWAYISSGTWSLVGVELPAPIRTRAAMEAGFTNEVGVGRRIRFLRNVSGLWLVQECRRAWAAQRREFSFEELARLAEESAARQAFVDPDAAAFAEFGDMPGRIRDYCRATGQSPPESEGATIRCVLESLVLTYRAALETAERLTGRRVKTLYVVGGGSRNRLLCQLTADATGRCVVAGPAEATAAGNCLVQAMGAGLLSGQDEIRDVSRRSFELARYEPKRGTDAAWREAAARFGEILGRVAL